MVKKFLVRFVGRLQVSTLAKIRNFSFKILRGAATLTGRDLTLKVAWKLYSWGIPEEAYFYLLRHLERTASRSMSLRGYRQAIAILSANGNYGLAQETVEKALSRYSEDRKLLKCVARHYWNMGDPNGNAYYLERLYAKYSHLSQRDLYQLAKLYIYLADYDKYANIVENISSDWKRAELEFRFRWFFLRNSWWMKTAFEIQDTKFVGFDEEAWQQFGMHIKHLTSQTLRRKRIKSIRTRSIMFYMIFASELEKIGKAEQALKLRSELVEDALALHRDTDGVVLELLQNLLARPVGSAHDEIGSDLLARIASIDQRKLRLTSLRYIEKVLIWSGELVLASHIRNRIHKRTILELRMRRRRTVSTKLWTNACIAAIETSNKKVIDRVLESAFQSPLLPNGRKRSLYALYRLQMGSTDELRATFREFATKKECEFGNFLQDKTVAIVAPAPAETQNGPEIDSADVIVRMNVLAHDDTLDPLYYGSRTDVVSFSDDRLRFLEHTGQTELGEGIKFALVKPWIGKNVLARQEDKVIPMYTAALNTLSSTHGYNHVPRLVYFLVAAGCKSIKLYNMNLFLSKRAYNHSYRKGPSIASLFWADDNVFGGFRLLKNMYENGVVQADDMCRRVLQLDYDTYVKELEAIYRPRQVVLKG